MEIFTKWNRNKVVSQNKSKKKGKYNEVAYTRHGRDSVIREGSGSGSERKVPTVWVTTKDGRKYEIPVDPKTGKVPMEYIYARFLYTNGDSRNGHDRSPRKDIGIDAEFIHAVPEGGFTPQQLVETGWWQYPNETDIEGVDDTGALSFARQIAQAAKSAQNAGKAIICIGMPEKEQDKIKSVLAKDFTATELNKASKNGLIIMYGDPGRGAAACYVSRQETSSCKTPIIILRSDWSEEDLVHEFTHHLRHVDVTRGGLTRSPYKFNEDGERIHSSAYGSPSNFNSARNLEEAATVAESYVRIQKDPDGPNGYYLDTHVHGSTPSERSIHDRRALVPAGSTAKRGRKAENVVKSQFEGLSIAHARPYSPGSNALNYYNARKAAGTLPVAQKPTKKKAGDVTTARGMNGPVGAEATRSKNRRYIRARR